MKKLMVLAIGLGFVIIVSACRTPDAQLPEAYQPPGSMPIATSWSPETSRTLESSKSSDESIDFEISIAEINQKIRERYADCSTMKYTSIRYTYEDNQLKQTYKYTLLAKQPDKYKTVMQAKISDRVINKINISNKNTTYDLSLPDSIRINEYVNLPPDMSAYSDQRFQQGIPVWQLPSDLDNEARYKVTMANELYEGKEALKITAVMLLDDRAKQKQIAIGNTPREPVKVIWFDMESLTILKEIYYGYYFSGPSSTTTVVTVIPGATPLKTPLVSPSARPAASDPPESMQQIETRNETVYQDYSFDFEIPDSEFEIDPQDYPGARITRTEVDLQEKLK